jgi:glutamine synthetase
VRAREDVKFVDVRFCDLPGVMQHFNVPAESVDEDFFTNGQMFDGRRSVASRRSTSRT